MFGCATGAGLAFAICSCAGLAFGVARRLVRPSAWRPEIDAERDRNSLGVCPTTAEWASLGASEPLRRNADRRSALNLPFERVDQIRLNSPRWHGEYGIDLGREPSAEPLVANLNNRFILLERQTHRAKVVGRRGEIVCLDLLPLRLATTASSGGKLGQN